MCVYVGVLFLFWGGRDSPKPMVTRPGYPHKEGRSTLCLRIYTHPLRSLCFPTLLSCDFKRFHRYNIGIFLCVRIKVKMSGPIVTKENDLKVVSKIIEYLVEEGEMEREQNILRDHRCKWKGISLHQNERSG